MNVFVACDFPIELQQRFIQRLGATCDTTCNTTGRILTPAELLDHAQGCQALVVTATDRLDAATIQALPQSVRVVATYSVGHEHIDLDALRQRNIILLSTPDVLSESCADTAWLLMLGAARRAIESIDLLRSGRWIGWRPGQLIGQDVWGTRLGVYGMGRIGRAIARRAIGFDMAVHYHNRSRLAPELENGATYHASLAELARHSDFLCVACPSAPETRGSVNTQVLQALPQGAIVCNISRGDIIQDDALLAALHSGHVAAVGLDVFAGEPDIHPSYRTLPNVFGLPHIGSSTWGTRFAMADLLCQGIEAVFAGRTPGNQVPNP